MGNFETFLFLIQYKKKKLSMKNHYIFKKICVCTLLSSITIGAYAQSCATGITFAGSKIKVTVPGDWAARPTITIVSDAGGGAYSGASSNWSSTNNYATLTQTLILVDGATTKTCIYTAGVLPIELMSFTAKLNDAKKIDLKWSTATEVNNDYFTIEKSVNGITFAKVGTIQGSGNSSTQKDYSYVDESPTEGNSYYRIKQTDFDGKNETFNAVAVYYESKSDGGCILKVFPNPCIGQCNVSLEDCDNTGSPEIAVEIMDAAGNKVYSKIPYTDEKGLFNFQIDTENNLKPGIYIVRGANKKTSYAQKLIVK